MSTSPFLPNADTTAASRCLGSASAAAAELQTIVDAGTDLLILHPLHLYDAPEQTQWLAAEAVPLLTT